MTGMELIAITLKWWFALAALNTVAFVIVLLGVRIKMREKGVE